MYLAITLARLEDFDNACSAYDKVSRAYIQTQAGEGSARGDVRTEDLMSGREHASRSTNFGQQKYSSTLSPATKSCRDVNLLLLAWPFLTLWVRFVGYRGMYPVGAMFAATYEPTSLTLIRGLSNCDLPSSVPVSYFTLFHPRGDYVWVAGPGSRRRLPDAPKLRRDPAQQR